MRVAEEIEVRSRLRQRGLIVGGWGQVLSANADGEHCLSFRPSRDANELYVAAHRIHRWLGASGWLLICLDHSTSPLADEIAAVETLLLEGASWNCVEQRAFLLEQDDPKLGAASVIFYLMLLFEWHVHVIYERSNDRRRLGLLDGTVHFFGDAFAEREAASLKESLLENPLEIDPLEVQDPTG